MTIQALPENVLPARAVAHTLGATEGTVGAHHCARSDAPHTRLERSFRPWAAPSLRGADSFSCGRSRPVMENLTRILERAGEGDAQSARRLATLLYEELRSLARREMAGERPEHTLEPTALVHEAYLRLMSGEPVRFENRAHFFGAAASAIRRVLVEHARSRGRVKRGDGRARVDFDAVDVEGAMPSEDLCALDEALGRLAEFAPVQARIVELRFFAGMTIPEVARLLSVSETTVQRDWRLARAWLKGELGAGDGT